MNEGFYNFFVRRNPFIRYEYERYVMEHLEEHKFDRFKHWKLLLSLNWHYRIQESDKPLLYGEANQNKTTWQIMEETQNPQPISVSAVTLPEPEILQVKPTKLPYLKGAESRSRSWVPPYDLVRTLNTYDVVSFDIFDTLLFRPLELPRHVFLIVGNELNILNFINIRINAENKLRDEQYRKNGHREITIDDIYKEIERQTGLKAELGIKTELRVELDLCFANPYMKYVFDTLRGLGKRICLVSDMYLQSDKVEQLLQKCGYQDYEKLFISCEYTCSKRDGGLFDRLKEYVGENNTIIHVGDNPVSDIERAKEKGIDVFFYENVNKKGKGYRTSDIKGLIGSAYRGIVNSHLHNGYKRYDAYYEYGFIYGGLFMLGFAEHIHEYAKNHNVDKILFVARDGYLMKQVYDQCFRDIPTEYILCSRISNLKMSAYCNKNSFMKEYVYRWRQDGIKITVRDVLENMELGTLASELEKYVPLDCIVNKSNTEDIIHFIDDYWKEITQIYEKTTYLAKEYYANFFTSAKKVLVVDVGWRGQTVLALRNLERDYWHFGCEIVGMLAASAPTYECQGQLQAGILNTYMFSPIDNISCFESHSKNSINNILTELLLGAPMPSFSGFKANGSTYELQFDVPEISNYETIEKIHTGIQDFVNLYKDAFSQYEYMYRISGYDAYMPLKHIFKDYSFIKRFFGKYEFQDSVGGTAGENSRTIKDVFKKFNL